MDDHTRRQEIKELLRDIKHKAQYRDLTALERRAYRLLSDELDEK